MSTRERVYKLIDTLDEEKLKALLLLFDNSNDIDTKSDNQVEELMGIFSDCANPELIPLEKTAWEQAAAENEKAFWENYSDENT